VKVSPRMPMGQGEEFYRALKVLKKETLLAWRFNLRNMFPLQMKCNSQDQFPQLPGVRIFITVREQRRLAPSLVDLQPKRGRCQGLAKQAA